MRGWSRIRWRWSLNAPALTAGTVPADLVGGRGRRVFATALMLYGDGLHEGAERIHQLQER